MKAQLKQKVVCNVEIYRKKYAANMFSELEKWAAENRYSSAVLKTGKNSP